MRRDSEERVSEIATQTVNVARRDQSGVVSVGAVGEGDVEGLLLAVAHDGQLGRVARFEVTDRGDQPGRAVDRRAVDGDHEVVDLDAGIGRRGAGIDARHHGTLAAVGAVGEPDAEERLGPLGALGLGAQRLDHRQRFAHRDREPDVRRRRGRTAAGDGGVDADDLAGGVDERAARVARRDRRIGLDQSVEECSVGADRAIERRHDAERDRRVAVEPEREADGDDLVAEAHAVGIGERGCCEAVAVHPQQGEVVADIHRRAG